MMGKINSINNKTGSLTIDPGASGDSFVQFDINGTGEFRIGVDDTDSDAFVISQGSALGTNNTFRMSAAGERTLPLQPAFFAYLSSTQSNVTGDNTAYTIICDTVVINVGSGYNNSTGIYTAPRTGYYFFHYRIAIATDASGGDEVESKLVTSNNTYYGTSYPGRNRLANFGGPAYIISHEYCVLANMDVSDTAYVVITSGNNSKLDDVWGAATVYTSFDGYLAC